MSRKLHFLLFLPILIVVVATAGSPQTPPATTLDSTGDPNVFIHQSIIEMVAAELPKEIIITKIQTSKTNFDLPTPARVELNTGGVFANVLKAIMTPKNAPSRHGSHKSLTKERT